MTSNMGPIDRALRVIVGLALIAAAFGVYGTTYQSVWGWIGIIPIASVLFGTCPVYKIFGITTCTPAKVG